MSRIENARGWFSNGRILGNGGVIRGKKDRARTATREAWKFLTGPLWSDLALPQKRAGNHRAEKPSKDKAQKTSLKRKLPNLWSQTMGAAQEDFSRTCLGTRRLEAPLLPSVFCRVGMVRQT